MPSVRLVGQKWIVWKYITTKQIQILQAFPCTHYLSTALISWLTSATRSRRIFSAFDSMMTATRGMPADSVVSWGDLNHVSSLALLCHSDTSISGCQPRVSSAWSISLTLCWRLYSGYLCKNLFSGHNFVENTLRFPRLQNLTFRIEYFVVTWYFGWGAQVLLEEAWPRPD